MKDICKSLLPCIVLLKNDVREVSLLDAFVREICSVLQMDETTATNVCLAVEEAVVNVMRYAYTEGSKGEIRVSASASNDKLTFEIRDNGKPFDPTAAENPDITLSAGQRPIGGLGIFLMRRYMDAMNYKRECDSNVLTLTKYLSL